MIRVRLDDYSAATDPADGYGMRTVRLTRGGHVGRVIGTINYDEGHRLWVALQPEVEGHAEGTYEPTATDAVRWLLQEFTRGGVAGR